MLLKKFLLSWGMLFAYVLMNAYGALMLKHQINKLGIIPFNSFGLTIGYFINLFKSPLSISAFISIFLSAIVYMVALSRMEISLAYPVAVGLNFLLVIFVAILFMGEAFTIKKIVGIALIFISIFILSR